MIQEFSLTNFLSIKDTVTISFEAGRDTTDEHAHIVDVAGAKLLKIAAIYGANASGKSNILHAFQFCINFILKAYTNLEPDEDIGFQPFAFEEETRNADGKFELVFFIQAVKYVYCISFNDEFVRSERLEYSPNGQKKLIFDRTKNENDDKRAYTYKFGDMLTGNKKEISERARPNATFLNAAAQFNFPVLKEIHSSINNLFDNLLLPDHSSLLEYSLEKIEKNQTIKEKVLTLLTNTDFSHISDITFEKKLIPNEVISTFPYEIKKRIASGETTRIYISHNYAETIPLSLGMESAGTRRMLALSVPLISLCTEKKILLIDELESSLHPDLTDFFLKNFLENTTNNNIHSQLLFSTHNTDLLESDLLRDDEVWFAEKLENGSTVFNRITDFTGVRKSVSRKTLYNAGKFGAKPIVGRFTVEK